jgi:hypothetical protein
MKNIVASVGLVALGASVIQMAHAQTQSADTSKPWSVSATLRGFYDDNFNALPDTYFTGLNNPNGYAKSALGFEISPSAAVAWNLENTKFSLDYTFSFKQYDEDFYNSTDNSAKSHTFTALLEHSFSERLRASVRDSFVVGQEPDLLRAGNTFSTFQRVTGDNMLNYGNVLVNADITRQFGIEVGYDNVWYNYADDGTGSLSATLDRIEQTPHIDARYKFTQQTTGLLGYQFGLTDYTADELLSPTSSLMSDVRNSRANYIYAGADHNFSPEMSGKLRAGARFTDFYNDSNAGNNTSPYVKASLRYLYAPESFVEGGFSYDFTASDVLGMNAAGTSVSTGADAATIYASMTHRITPKLFVNLLGQIQWSTYVDGIYDGETDRFYLAGLNLEYRFTKNFLANVGYNYDNLTSDIPNRSYDRNRVYIGVTASY